ncbi:MAG: TPM domain-containing protein, partial [Actinomycetota bacterium]|nr:TPM domain-containing protein [Actinomycetota bacterium]
MNKLRRGIIVAAILAIAALMFTMGTAGAALQLPEPGGHVNDFAGMLSSQTVDEFEAKLTQYEKETGNEIAVVTVENLQGTTVEDFAVRLFEKWAIGKKDKDNGALLLVAKDERQMRIEVGYGLEPDLTDAESHQIISNVITPAFKAGDFDKGVREGVDAMVSTIAGEAVPATETESRREPGGDISWLIYLFGFVVFGGLQWVGAVLAR